MHKYAIAVLILYLSTFGVSVSANSIFSSSVILDSSCQSDHSLAVIHAIDLPSLLGKPVGAITLWRNRNQELVPISSQIDRRDLQKRYILEETSAAAGGQALLLSADDEIVFRLADAGTQRLSTISPDKQGIVAEIQINHPLLQQPRWVYAIISTAGTNNTPASSPVKYQLRDDSVTTDFYKAGFDNDLPFLINDFRWRTVNKPGFSPNVIDSMKIQHSGNIFGLIRFIRTGSDYRSKLTQVKTGPLRTIRRTENRVHILWGLKTPTLYVDYVMMPDSFVMDTIIDIPFRMGLFFGQVETLTTVDWRKDDTLPPIKISSPGTTAELLVTGQMTAEKHKFNTVNDTRFSVYSDLGIASVILDIPDDFPIKPWLYINDDIRVTSRSESQPGNFGNTGYRTTGWENIDTDVYHLKFTTCLSPGGSSHAP